MATRSIIAFMPSKDYAITFDPAKCPEKNPFAEFPGVEQDVAITNVNKNSREVVFEKGVIYATYCHWDGYLKGVGETLATHFADEENVSNLLAAGELSAVVDEVVPYTTRGEAFAPPKKVSDEKELHKIAEGYGAEYVYLYTADTGWKYCKRGDIPNFASVSDALKS